MEPVSGKAVTSPLRLFLLASAMALSMSSPSATCAVVGGISLTVGYPSDPEEIVYDSDHGTQGVDFSERIIAGNSSYGIRFTGASDIKSSIIDAGGTVILNVDKDAGIFIGNEDAVTPGAYRTAIDFNGLSGATANPVSITFYEDGSHEISAYLNGVGCAGLGAGAAWNTCPEPFNWWYIGGMKNSAVSVTSSACAATYGLGLSAASDFPDSSFCNWTFGKFLSGNSICAVAKETNPSATAYATTFGAAYVNTVKESQFKNWSVEFSGNQTIAALAYCNNDGFNVAANCLGGWTNEDMRFYFNGEGSEDETPKVQVVGARFSAINFVTGAVYPDHPVVPFEPIAPKPKPPQQILRQAPLDASWISYVDLSFSSNQDDTRAISMGNGFQLNVGRTRAMEDGSETDSSKAGGGETASVNHGVLNLIGAVARTPYLTASGVAPSDTVMRIDGGWTVNCFGNVRDLRNIDLIDGKLVLVNANPGDKNWHVFEEAANAFERSVAIRGPLAIYRGAGNGDDGGGDNYYVALDHSHYPVRGSLSISESDTVTFHIPENSIGGDYDQDKLYPLRAAGTIELLGAENGMINFETGWNFNLDTESLASGQSDMANCAFIVLVEAPAGTDENAIGGLNFGHLNGEYMISSAEGFGFKDDASVSLSRAAKTIKSIPDEFALYWFTNPVLSGLALAPRSDETLAGFRDNTYGIKLSGTDTNFPNEIILDKGGHNLYVTISVCDPMLTNGDYGIKFGDSLKNIHWKASLDLKFTNESNSQAAVLKVTADGDKATVIDFNGLNGTEKFPICVTFDPDNWNNEISARATNDNYGNAVVFGGCSITGSANSYNNWKVGGLKNSNILAAGTARAAAFGASYVDGTPNSFCNWSIDGVSGCAAATSVYNFDSLVALTVFGAADAHGNQTNSFCNWSFNNFQDGNSICALAYGGRLLPNVAAFGPGYAGDATMKGSFKNWSAEFSGSQTIATLANGLSSSSVAVNCLGGWANEDMRFYFNCVARDKETNPTVNIAAVKLSSVNPNGSSESIVLTLSGKQGNDEAWGADSVNKDYVYDKRGWARALSIGNGFQLNVGRTRILDSYGRETADSISYGGKTDPSYWAGTVNLIGAVARSPELACAGSRPENTTLRIDNGWIVKCFGPVKDLRTIDLINGCLALVNCDASESHIKSDSEDDDHWSVFLDAARSLEAGLAIVDGDKFYRGGINEADLYPDRDGYVELSYEGYPVRGSLTMSSGDRLLVHLNSNAFNFAESYDSLFASAAAGTIYLAGENEMLFLEDGWNISWGDIPLPWNALLLVAIGEPHTPHSVVNGLSFAYAGTYGVSDDPSGDGPLLTGKGNKTVDLFRATTNVNGMPGDYSLYWFENGALHGLAIAHHGAPSHLVSVASGMMAMEKQHTVNLVRDTAKLYGEGPFIGSVTSTLKRKELAKNRFGSKEKAHGIVLGANRLVTLGMTDLSCSVFVGITNGKATYDGPFVEKLLKSNRNDFSCGGLARQNFMGFRDMDASINASLLISSGRIRWHRETARGCLYDSKMNDFALQLGADIDHEFYRYGYFELGCFAGMNYDSIGQNGFSEKSPNTAPSSCVSISSMRHNFFAFDLGISVKTAKITNVELNGKLGFHCAALRKHGTATTLIFGTENEAAIHYGSKNCATISAGGSYEFKENWHCAFGLDGKFSSAFRAFSASMSFGHRF